jgi:uncharacterized protein YjbI with pentapeptide repeats
LRPGGTARSPAIPAVSDPPSSTAWNTLGSTLAPKNGKFGSPRKRILATHLRPGDLDQPDVTFWPGIDIDLTGATLIDLDFSDCHLRDAQFTGAEFICAALFEGTRFGHSTRFDGARFTGAARLTEARFEGGVTVNRARSGDHADFNGAEFMGGDYLDPIDFRSAKFGGFAEFSFATSTSGPSSTAPSSLETHGSRMRWSDWRPSMGSGRLAGPSCPVLDATDGARLYGTNRNPKSRDRIQA